MDWKQLVGGMMNQRQLGKFRIPRELVDRNPQVVADIFGILECVVVRAEMLFHVDQIEYVGISPRFEVVPPGQMVPRYCLEVTVSEAGDIELVLVSQVEANSAAWYSGLVLSESLSKS